MDKLDMMDNNNNSSNNSNSRSTGTSWALGSLKKLYGEGNVVNVSKRTECLIKSWVSLEENPLQEPYCEAIWDEIFCWPATARGETVSRPCSEVMKDDEEVDGQNIIGDAYRICSANGTWLWGNWTNYNQCVEGLADDPMWGGDDKDLLVIKDTVRYILFIGSILSLVCLCTALFIFCYFKSIRCDRIVVHIHLMLALALRFFLLIVITEPFIFHRSNHYRQVDWLCKLILALQFYAMSASINWMFVQGHYLNSRLTTSIFDGKLPLRVYCTLGWGLPLCFVLAWSAVMEEYHRFPCWRNYGSLPYNWIIVGPMLLVLLANLVFLTNILRILLTKIQLTSMASESEQFRRGVKSSILLFPLLGINNLLFFYNPGGCFEMYYMIVNSCLQSSQGVFVSLLYCFMSQDVKDAIRRSYCRFILQRAGDSRARARFRFSSRQRSVLKLETEADKGRTTTASNKKSSFQTVHPTGCSIVQKFQSLGSTREENGGGCEINVSLSVAPELEQRSIRLLNFGRNSGIHSKKKENSRKDAGQRQPLNCALLMSRME